MPQERGPAAADLEVLHPQGPPWASTAQAANPTVGLWRKRVEMSVGTIGTL